jgi:hypothetical protein
VEPKFVPVMVTGAPTAAEAVDRLEMTGVGNTVNAAPALAIPFTVTTTLPVVAPAGTGATIVVALQLLGVAAMPLKVSVLAPWAAPKFVPLMVTGVPTALDGGETLAMLGGLGGGGGGGLLLPPQPARASVAANAIPRQRIRAFLNTFPYLT